MLFVWLGAAVFGICQLERYANRAETPSRPPAAWPDTAALRRSRTEPTLVLFLHPKCPCSRATLDELAIALTHAPGRCHVAIVFCVPRSPDKDWLETGLWDRARLFTGAELIPDLDGALATTFAANTSGQCLLYDAGGTLVFSGGITRSRGHSGDNAGRAAIEHRLLGTDPMVFTYPVFGCALLTKGNSTPSRDPVTH